MPSGKVAQPAITDNKDGTVTVRYAPSEAGLHEMDIRYDNMHIPGAPPSMPPPPYRGVGLGEGLGGNTRPPFHVAPLPASGSPLQFYVDYVNCGHVTAYGPGLTHGVVNKPAVFTVNTKDAGEGERQLSS